MRIEKTECVHYCAFGKATFVLQVAFLLLTPCFARERGPRVEVVCPSPPISASIDRNKVLVYELHVTNFDSMPLTLKRVEIFANKDCNQQLTSLEGDKLSAAMIRVGAAMTMSSGSSGAPVPGNSSGASNCATA